MRLLRYAINVTLDGCVHHEAGIAPDEESMEHWTRAISEAGGLIYGRQTYEMMEAAWRRPSDGAWPTWMQQWDLPFAEAIDAAPKHVVSRTLERADWNAELIRADLAQAVERLKGQPGGPLLAGGVRLPVALADLGLIDEYEFVVQPVVSGGGPRLLEGLRERLSLDLVDRQAFASGAVVLRYRASSSKT
jgi:dihydrofolate reductase